MGENPIQVIPRKSVLRVGEALPVEVVVWGYAPIGARGLTLSVRALIKGELLCSCVKEDYANPEETYASEERMGFSLCVGERRIELVKGDVHPGTYQATNTLPESAPPTFRGELFSVEWFVEAKVSRMFRKDMFMK